jgi:hypothetical protein
MRKDFGLILNEAAKLGLSMPATEAAAANNSEEAASGREEDFSAVIRRMEQQACGNRLKRINRSGESWFGTWLAAVPAFGAIGADRLEVSSPTSDCSAALPQWASPSWYQRFSWFTKDTACY